MKLIKGDTVQIMVGKDRGKQGEVTQVFPKTGRVLVAGLNMYTRHVKPYGEQRGDKTTRERALAAAKVAIVNEKGQPDRVGYKVAKDGSKQRIFRKTGTVIATAKPKAVKQTKKTAKK